MARARSEQGFTLVECMFVCAIVGVMVALAFPSMTRYRERQEAKSSATSVAGLLNEARARATTEATPYIVYFNPKTVDSAGHCGPLATLVRDSDRSYSITPGDTARDIEFPPSACGKVELYGDVPSTPLDLTLPVEDLSLRAAALAPGGPGPGGKTKGGKVKGGKVKGGSAPTAKVVDAVVTGATFPVDATSGRPVVAFSERGIPVDPEDPTNWGSGSGGVYLLVDGQSAVYGALVQPLGAVVLRVSDSSGDWR
jgi:prepilin-type N-terminal cleavage/methylation domain-containing protein